MAVGGVLKNRASVSADGKLPAPSASAARYDPDEYRQHDNPHDPNLRRVCKRLMRLAAQGAVRLGEGVCLGRSPAWLSSCRV